MKKSILKSMLIFAAGASCAGGVMEIVGGYYGDVDRYRSDGDQLLVAIANYGLPVVATKESRVYIAQTDGACIRPPPNPKQPVNGNVDWRLFDRGVASLRAQLLAKQIGDETPVQLVDKCQVDPGY
jgi:hypothetical protein